MTTLQAKATRALSGVTSGGATSSADTSDEALVRLALQEFLDSLKENFAAAKSDPTVSSVVDVLFADLSRPAPAGSQHPRRLSACRHLPDAIDLAKSASPELARLARSFEAIEH